jgi:hypothetical protein
MIISKKNKFVFVKGNKVASTSMEILLSKYCNNKDIITPITPIDELKRIASGGNCCRNYLKKRIFNYQLKEEKNYLYSMLTANEGELSEIKLPSCYYYNHMSLSEIESKYGVFDESWLVLAIDRNPYDKIISRINMNLKFNSYKNTGEAMISGIEDIRNYTASKFDISDYISVRNIDLYKDKNENLKAKVLKYEDLNDELNRVFNRLGLKSSPLPMTKQGVGTKKIDPAGVFSREQLDQINNYFSEEFNVYGYEKL